MQVTECLADHRADGNAPPTQSRRRRAAVLRCSRRPTGWTSQRREAATMAGPGAGRWPEAPGTSDTPVPGPAVPPLTCQALEEPGPIPASQEQATPRQPMRQVVAAQVRPGAPEAQVAPGEPGDPGRPGRPGGPGGPSGQTTICDLHTAGRPTTMTLPGLIRARPAQGQWRL